MAEIMNKYYSLSAAAGKLNMTKAKLYMMIKNKEISCHQPSGKGGRIYINEDIVLNPEEYFIDEEAEKNYKRMLSRMGY